MAGGRVMGDGVASEVGSGVHVGGKPRSVSLSFSAKGSTASNQCTPSKLKRAVAAEETASVGRPAEGRRGGSGGGGP